LWSANGKLPLFPSRQLEVRRCHGESRGGDKGEAAAIWKQGATFVDVNNDGGWKLCLPVNAPICSTSTRVMHLQGRSRRPWLAVVDASVMGRFATTTRDGWLDVYVQTNLLDGVNHPTDNAIILFHNNRDGTFTDVTDRAVSRGKHKPFVTCGITTATVGRIFMSRTISARPDTLYPHNRDSTFTNVIDQVVPHMPYSSMGSELGDLNNDGLIDLLATENGRNHPSERPAHHASHPRSGAGSSEIPRRHRNTSTTRCT